MSEPDHCHGPDRELLQQHLVHCPYCGEPLEIDVDCSVRSQSYIEDCQVCCRPIAFQVEVDEDLVPSIVTRHEDD